MNIQTIETTPWPFKYVNGHQTPQSKALQDTKALHRPEKPSLAGVPDALL
jgi:hypothetical protein